MNVISDKQVQGRRGVVGAIIGVHVAVIGTLVFSQGCGTTGGRRHPVSEESQPPAAVMPPSSETVKARTPPPPLVEPATHSADLPKVAQEVGPTYTVESGDSLSSIAARYGVSAREIAEMNGIRDLNKLRVGTKLSLPAYARSTPAPKKAKAKKTTKPATESTAEKAAAPTAAAGEYVVKSGDSLSVIAKRNGTTVKALREANNLKSDALKINQKLVIPGAAAATQAPVIPEPAPVAPAPVDPSLAIPPTTATPGTTPAVIPGSPAPTPATGTPAPTPAPTPALGAPAATPAAGAAPAPADEPFQYTVRAGDTLDSVARIFGVVKEQLATFNALPADATLTPGQRIKIPFPQ